MSKKAKTKKFLSSVAASAMILGTVATPAIAAPGDYYLTSTHTTYTAAAIKADPSIKNVLRAAAPSDVLVDFSGSLLKYTDANSLIGQLMVQHKSLLEISTALKAPNAATSSEDVTGYTAADQLLVSSVSAINSTTVTVTLANVPTVLPAASTFTVTDTNSNTYAVTALAATGTAGEYTLTLGTAVAGKGTLTVAYGTSSATKDFDTTTAGTTLSVEASADLTNGLTADGADNTIITVDVLQNGVLNKSFNGTVLFQSLKGATFAKNEVAFDQGKASVQLTSIASASEIDDTIIATINNATDSTNIGKTTQIPVKYVPANANGGSGAQVYGTVAIGNTSGDVKLKFNNTFDFSKLYADWVANPTIIKVNGNVVDDIKSVDSTTVDLVLFEADALQDNATVTVQTSTSANPLTAALLPSTLSYNLVDATAPAAVGLTTPDYRTLVAQFTEPVVGVNAANTLDVLNPANWVLNGTRLSGADVSSITYGKAIADGTVQSYVNSATAPIDNRNYVTIVLSSTASHGLNLLNATGKTNLLQAYNVQDYAGLTDTTGQNYATTQEFSFVSPAAPNAPTATVTMDSPEQYRVTFNQPLVAPLVKGDFAVKGLTDVASDGTKTWTAIDGSTTLSADASAVAPDFNVTPIDGAKNDVYLIELNKDWTLIDATAATGVNYYAPKHNMVQITTLAAGATGVKNNAGVAMAADSVQALTMSLDSTSPTIALAAQEVDASNNPLQLFDVTMSEPVQMVDATPAKDSVYLTPSQTQTNGIPTPTFQFVSADGSTTVDGVLNAKIAPTDESFVVKPISTLAAGNWTLYVRSISDDVGNTSSTTSYPLTVKGATAATGSPTIVWADAHDNVAGLSDVVDIQFGTTMSTDALKSTMYTVNGNVLPVGTMITSKLVKYDVANNLSGTLVTITLPVTFLGDTTTATDTTIVTPGTTTTPDIFSTSKTPNILNVSKSLTATDGTPISGATQVQMDYGTPQDL